MASLTTKFEHFFDLYLKDKVSKRNPITVVCDLKAVKEGFSLKLYQEGYSFKFKYENKKDGRVLELKEGEIPPEFKMIESVQTMLPYSMFYINEFKVLCLFSRDFEVEMELWMFSGVSNHGRQSRLSFKDFVKFLIQLNITNLYTKSQTFLATYAKTGKAKGLSETEVKYMKDAILPIYVMLDHSKLVANSTDYSKMLTDVFERADIFIQNKLSEDFEERLILDNGVYILGNKAYRETNQAQTLYIPKIELIYLEFDKPLDYLINMYKIVETTDEQIIKNSIISKILESESYKSKTKYESGE